MLRFRQVTTTIGLSFGLLCSSVMAAPIASENQQTAGKTWTYTGKTIQTGLKEDNFPMAIAGSGKWLAASDVDREHSTGSVYLFSRRSDDSYEQVTMWSETGRQFGNALAMSNAEVFVGSLDKHQVDIYSLSDLKAAPETLKGSYLSLFGASIVYENDWLIIGSPTHDLLLGSYGRVSFYHFENGQWAHKKDINGAIKGSCFGVNLAIENGMLAVSAAPQSPGVLRRLQAMDTADPAELLESLQLAEEQLGHQNKTTALKKRAIEINNLIGGVHLEDQNTDRVYVYQLKNNDWVAVGDPIVNPYSDADEQTAVAVINGSVAMNSPTAINEQGVVSVFAFDQSSRSWKQTNSLKGTNTGGPVKGSSFGNNIMGGNGQLFANQLAPVREVRVFNQNGTKFVEQQKPLTISADLHHNGYGDTMTYVDGLLFLAFTGDTGSLPDSENYAGQIRIYKQQ